MKILLRTYDGNHYVWKDAYWKNERYYISDTDLSVSQTAILAVTEDERTGKVQCRNCGELIDNNEESIEAHFRAKEAEKNCLTCERCVPYGDKFDEKKTFSLNKDGTYTISESYTTFLGCKIGYYNVRDLDSDEAKRRCNVMKCRNMGTTPINDIFVKYPDPFEKQITVDALVANKYTSYGSWGEFVEYDLKMRDTLKARVNKLGIVDHFVVIVRGWRYEFDYSSKYNKIFFRDYGEYKEHAGNYISSAKEERILNRLSKLYMEENK